MNRHARSLLSVSALLGILALAPLAASAEYAPRTPCAVAPPVQPVIISPFAGATNVPLEGNWVEIAAPLDGVPPLDQQRVVLTDSTPYAIDGGTLQPTANRSAFRQLPRVGCSNAVGAPLERRRLNPLCTRPR